MKVLIRLFAILIAVTALTSPVSAGRMLRGVAVDGAGAPAAGLHVALLSGVQGEPGRPIGGCTTAQDGSFKIVYAAPALSTIHTGMYLTASSHGLLGLLTVGNPDATQRIVCRPRGSISGVVRLADGKVVQGATIVPEHFLRSGFFGREYISFRKIEVAAGIAPAVSDAQGRFVIRGLPAGFDVALVASKPGYDSGATGSSQDSAVPVGVADAVITLAPAKQTPPSGLISGTLLDEKTRKPMPGVRVLAVDASDPESVSKSRALTDADGRFEFRVPPGEYTLWVLESDRPVIPEAGVQVGDGGKTTVTLYAVEGTSVSGHVVDVDAGEGIGGVMVVSPGSRPVLTRADGSFSIRLLPGPGMLSVIGDERGYDRLEHELDVPESGALDGLELTLPHATVIQGRITDSAGKPVDGALVRVAANSPSDTIQADTKGEFSHILRGLPSGDSAVYVVAFDPVTQAGALAPISPESGKVNRVEIALRPAASVAGIVRDESGKPILGATILPMLDVGRIRVYAFHNQARSDAEGRYRIDGLIPDARYSVRIDAAGYHGVPLGKEQLPELKSGESASAEFVLPAK